MLTALTFARFIEVAPILRDRKKLSATRSLSAPSVRQRLSADETLAFWRGRNVLEACFAHCKSVVCWLCVSHGLDQGEEE